MDNMFKNTFKSVTKLMLILMLILMAVTPVALAEDETPDSDGFLNDKTIDVLKNFKDESGFRSFSNNTIDGATDEKGLDNITGVIFYLIDIMKWAAGGLALIFLVITLVKTISAGTDGAEEQYGKLKKHLVHIASAFVVIFVIDFFVTNVFVITGGQNFLGGTDEAKIFARAASGELMGIYRVLQAVAGTATIATLVFSGFRLVSNAGNEEVTDKAKKHVMYAVGGLILLGIAEIVVQGFLFKDAGSTIDVNTGKEIIVKLTNFAAGFVSTASVISMLYAGYLYVASGVGEDNADKVKKIIIGAVVGIILSAGAFAAVNTFIELDTERAPEVLQNQVDNLGDL